MSVKLVNRVLDDFIKTDIPETICIRGKWGVGKSHTWITYIVNAITSRKVALPYYSYVSLFGVNSIDELRQEIFEQLIETTQENKGQTPKKFLERYARRGAQLSSRFAEYVHAPLADSYIRNFAGGFRHLISLTVQRTIICIDDFERKGANLRVTDILGVVSNLKELKKCKILLIMNIDALTPSDRDDFNKYFEKVIDGAIDFIPTPEEVVDIGLNSRSALYALLRNTCLELGLSNIRVIRKVERIAIQIYAIINEFDANVIHYVYVVCVY